jgi:hypothetical protein
MWHLAIAINLSHACHEGGAKNLQLVYIISSKERTKGSEQAGGC